VPLTMALVKKAAIGDDTNTKKPAEKHAGLAKFLAEKHVEAS
jgi:hypothetical protein